MIHRTPQRSYTTQAIERWFARLSRDWETFFKKEELDWGRRYYRNGEIRSTELLEGSAIVHFRRGKEPLYVIVDWEGEKPSFRQSHPEFAPGRALAVAGMYGLEEFIAEEIPPIMDLEAIEAESDAARRAPPTESPAPTKREGRQLEVRLLAREDGLWSEAGWSSANGAAFWGHFSLRELTRWEREQLIGFTARAHRCGFRPGDREGAYRMQDPSTIRHFFRKDYPDWKRRFRVEEDPALQQWKHGLQSLRPLIQVGAEGGQSRYKIGFAAGGRSLADELGLRILRQPGHTHFIPGQGIFQIDPRAIGAIHDWKTLLPEGGEGILPRYLIFNFARDPMVKMNLSKEMATWRKSLLDSELGMRKLKLPGILRSYQEEGIRWLIKLLDAGCHGLLADEMGLGKTLQILAFLDARQALGNKAVLVVCPASVVPVWQEEVTRFFPGTPVRVLSRSDTFSSEAPALWLSSYTQLRRHKHLLAGTKFEYAILDEAQNIKNPDAKVTHACFSIQAHHRIALTGTPLENRALDLWTLFRYLMPGFLGNRTHFEEQLKQNPAFLQMLRKQIQPFILRRTKMAVARELPEKVEINWTCALTPAQRSLYTALVDGAADAFQGELAEVLREKRMHLFGLLTRLRQVCCDPALLPGQNNHWQQSGKLVSLVSRLEEAFSGGSRVVVFSQFVQFLRRARAAVRESFPEVPHFELTGATVDRARPVAQFADEKGPGVFFVSLRAGGTGLNLQMADYVFLLDPWWNPAVEAQAIDRVHRLGQRQRVIVYRMITRGTIEERIEHLKQDKGQLFENLLSNLDAPGDLLKQFKSLEDLIRLEDRSGDSEGL